MIQKIIKTISKEIVHIQHSAYKLAIKFVEDAADKLGFEGNHSETQRLNQQIKEMEGAIISIKDKIDKLDLKDIKTLSTAVKHNSSVIASTKEEILIQISELNSRIESLAHDTIDPISESQLETFIENAVNEEINSTSFLNETTQS